MINKKTIRIILLLTLIFNMCFLPAYAKENLNADFKLNDNIIEVSGTGVTSEYKIVTVKIDAPDGNIFNINQITAETDGSFSYTVKLSDNDLSGAYTVSVSSRGTDGQIGGSIYYLSNDLKKLIAGEISSVSGTDDFDSAVAETVMKLAEYKTELGIDEFSDTEYENAAALLIWLNDGSYDYNDIKAVINRSKNLFDNFRLTDENTLTGYLKSNKDVLFESTDVYLKYDKFSSANKRAVNNSVLSGAPYDNFKALRDAVKKAVDETAASIALKSLYIQGDITVNVISVSGSGTESSKRIVTIKITNPNGEIVNINQITAQTDGSFSYSAQIGDDAPSGYYSISAFSRGIDAISVISDLFYLSEADRKSIVGTVNISDAAVIEKLLNDKALYMGISDLTKPELKTAAVVLNEQKPADGYTYEEILSMIYKSRELFSKILNAKWTELDEIITDNHEILLKNVSAYDTYKVKSQSERNKICAAVLNNAPFSDILSFRDAFISAASANGSTGASGGGSGGGSNSGSKGDSMSGINAYINPPMGSEAGIFNDMEGHEWAEEFVYGLLEKNIISPASDGKFRPADDITREEFIKLLVLAFSLYDSSAECDFSDVSKEEWYYSYVASAYKNKITEGEGPNMFGTGKKITRQDMASLAYRTISELGIKLDISVGEKTFNDSDMIAAYAIEAVSQMQKANVINGTESGNFEPLRSATRAEAAKIIYMLLSAAGR